MLLDGANALFRPFDSRLSLAIRELDEGPSLSELLVQIRSIIGMAPVEMYLESFGDELELMPESFGQNTSVSLRIGNVGPKCFGSRTDDLLDLN